MPLLFSGCSAPIRAGGSDRAQSTDDVGNRRLDDPADLVRVEIACALGAGKVVIPVLVEDAEMPESGAFPPPLLPLASRNALSISDLRWDYDVGRLITRLEALVDAPDQRVGTPLATVPLDGGDRPARARRPLVVGALVGGIGLAVLFKFMWGGPDASPPRPAAASTLEVPTAARNEYQRRIRDLCTQRRQSEAHVKDRSEGAAAGFVANSDFLAFFRNSMTLYIETTNTQTNLKGILKALDPPPDLAVIHNDSVEAWEREIDLEHQFTDEFRKAGQVGPVGLTKFFATYDKFAVTQLDDRINGGLVQLAGSGWPPGALSPGSLRSEGGRSLRHPGGATPGTGSASHWPDRWPRPTASVWS